MILAAGLGTRLLPLTKEKPKPIIPLLGKPLIYYTLEQLKKAGVNEVVINLHHLPLKIKDSVGDGSRFGLRIHYSLEPEILGSGGGLKKAESFLKDGTFFLLNGDIFFRADFKKIFDFHKKNKAFATMVLRKDKKVHEYGAIGIDSENRIRQFLGEPNLNGIPIQDLMFTGIHVLEPDIFKFLPEEEFSNINRVAYPNFLQQKKVLGYTFGGFWRECGNPQDYFQANLELLKKKKSKTPKITGVKIKPPVFIGKNCKIGKGARLGPNVIIGDNCVIGENSVLSNALLWDGVKTRAKSKITGQILGQKQKASVNL